MNLKDLQEIKTELELIKKHGGRAVLYFKIISFENSFSIECSFDSGQEYFEGAIFPIDNKEEYDKLKEVVDRMGEKFNDNK